MLFWIALFGRVLAQFSRFHDRNPFRSRKTRAHECTYSVILISQDGTINRDDFIAGMLESKFPTNKAELNAVFNIFDREHTGSINYREFIEALRPVRYASYRI